jgi:hypothetical protein
MVVCSPRPNRDHFGGTMKIGDLVALDLERVYLGFVADLGIGWVDIHFLDGDRETYDLDELEWEVVNESR